MLKKALTGVACFAMAGLAGCIPTTDLDEQQNAGAPAPEASPAETPRAAPASPQPGAERAVPPMLAAPQGGANESATAEELIAEWKTLAEEPLVNMGKPGALQIAEQLKSHGDDALIPLVDVIADPESSKEQQVFALFTLQNVMSPGLKDRVLEIARTAHDARTRGIAIQLLAELRDPELKPAFEEFANASEEFVRFPALQALAWLGSKDAQNKLVELYFDPEVRWDQQDRIVQTLAEDPIASYEDVFVAAADNMMLEPTSRVMAIESLGAIGDAETLVRLEELKANMEVPGHEQQMGEAIAQIRERHDLPAESSDESGTEADEAP